MKPRIHFCLSALLLSLGAAAATPSPVSNGEFTPLPDACKSEVAKFEETIGFIRQHQGNAAASALREKLLPAKVEAELLATQGYCGLVQYLREKKLSR